MARELFNLVVDAILASIHRIGTTPAGVVYALAGSVVFFVVKRSGVQARNVVEALVVGVLCWLPFFAFELARIPYEKFHKQVEAAQEASARTSELRATVARKRQSLDTSDPAYHNMLNTIGAFMRYREAIGPTENGWLLITPIVEGFREDYHVAWNIMPFAVLGARMGNGNLQNIGVRPENVETETRKVEIPGTLVIHALPNSKGVDQLVDALSNLMATKRSYEMPDVPGPIPSNVIWFQFGAGTKWNSERNEAIKP